MRLLGNLFDKNNFLGKKGYYLSSDEDGTRWIADPNETSGVFSGGVLSAIIGGTTFSVSAGVGQVVLRTVLPSGEVETTTTRITWNAQNNVSLTYRTTHKFSYIYIDENGVLQQQSNTFTDSQYRNQIVLGVICHINLSTINLVTNKQNVVYGDSHRLYELMSTFGPIKRSGLVISPFNTGLSVSRDSGTVLLIGSNYTTYQFEPDSPTINAVNPASICRVYRNGSGDFVFDTNGGIYYTGIDPTKYDDNSGTLQTVNNNQWTVQRLFFFPSNPNDIIVYYGFGVYNSLNDAFLAIENESFYEAQITAENAVFLGYILLRGGATNLSLITDARFIQSGVSRNVIVGGGGAAGLVLDDLLDVQITNPSDSQFFVYENSSGLWKNATFNTVNPLVFSGVGTSVSLSLNYATASQPGGVSTSAQTFGGAKTFANDVIISGNLTVNGTTTTVDTQTLLVEDKNIELGVVATPTNITADGGGITLKGTTDKTFNWINATSSWTSSENLDLANTKTYKINGTDVLSSTTLGSGVINSSLTSVGTLNNLTVAGYTHLATTSGSVGIGTTSPAYKLDVNGITRFRDVVRFKNSAWNLSDDGQVRFYFDVSGRTYFGSGSGYEWRSVLDAGIMALNNSGNLGIGTVTPLSRLDIRGSHATGYGILNIISTDTSIISIDSTGARDQGIRLKYNGADKWLVGMRDANESFSFSNASDTRLVSILQNGVVGIGTTVPAAKLHLYGASEIVQRIESAGSRTYGFVVNPSWRADSFSIYDFNADSARLLITSAGRISIGGGSAAPNNLLTIFGATSIGSNYNVAAPTNGLIVEGSVGIGATSSANKLTVVTSTQYDGYYLRNSNGVVGTMLGVSATNDDGTVGLYSNTVLKTTITANGVSYFNGGNVGIGTTNPLARLSVGNGSLADANIPIQTSSLGNGTERWIGVNKNGAYGLILGYYEGSSLSGLGAYVRQVTSDPLYFVVNNSTTAMTMLSGGNVGIGTITPAAKLDINGTTNFAANVYHSIGGQKFFAGSGGTYNYFYTGTTALNFLNSSDTSTLMTILNGGSIGIGTTAPSTKLEVIGTVKATLFDGPINQVNVTSDDSTNASYYLFFGTTNSGASLVKASTKIRFNPNTGAFSSTTKSFRIPHLIKSGYDLVYGSLESPYHGVRLTGKGKTNGNRAEVILPDYINVLVDKETVHIQLTPIKCAKILYVDDLFIDDNKFTVKYDKSWFEKAKDIEFYWDFTAERKDVPKLIVEEKQ